MSTLAQIRARVADDINRADLNTQIDLAINRSIEYYYNLERFWFNETTTTLSLVANQESYDTADGLASDIAEIDYVNIVLSSTNYQPLIERPFQWIQDMNQGRSTGDPTDYSWYQNKLYFYLIPNQVRTVNIFYKKTYSDLTLDADTNDYTTYAEDLIESRAGWWVYKRILKDFTAADQMKMMEMDALTTLRNRTSDMIGGSGQISATHF